MIWFNKNITIDDIKPIGLNTMGHFLGMEWVELGSDYLKMRMPVNDRLPKPSAAWLLP
jgi:1,4-dihydroxy-2-naphthoyl-CoA hydrolase